jgi:GAF domain-containing protein
MYLHFCLTPYHNVNFAGVYRYENGELILGPFQGMPACVHIQMGKGVCGTAAAKERTQIVPNVHEFAGHIACDSVSNSEIVIPIFKDQISYGVSLILTQQNYIILTN